MALIESYGSSLDFREKFSNQLEIKVGDLQRADQAGKALPLGLQFVSFETQELLGNSVSRTIEKLELTGSVPDSDGVAELEYFVSKAFNKAENEARTIPLLLAIMNMASYGIRNLFIETTINSLEGSFEIISSPSESNGTLTFDFLSFGKKKDRALESWLERFEPEALTHEAGTWKFSCSWDAIQPQRVMLIKPIVYFCATSDCKAEIITKIYADSFATPISLSATLFVSQVRRDVPQSDFIKEAKLLKAHDDMMIRPTVIRSENRDD